MADLASVAIWIFAFLAIHIVFKKEDNEQEAQTLDQMQFWGNTLYVANAFIGVAVEDSLVTYLILIIALLNWALNFDTGSKT